jgi:hypothetical protein
MTFKRMCAAMLSVVLAASQANAIWAPVALEILVDEAHLIVEGTVTEVKAPGFDPPDARPQELAVIKIESVLKALPGFDKAKEIGVLQPAAGGLAVSTDLRFRPGQKNIWLVKKDPKLGAYRVSHPSQIQPVSEKKKLTDLVKAREKVAGGKAVAGLVARAELIEHKAVGGARLPSYEIRFSLKNVSDKPITVFDFVGARPLTVDWTGPDGAKLESQHYDWLKAVRLRAPDASNFTTIPAGGVHFIGPRGRDGGIYFGGSELAGGNTLSPGKHRIIVSYRSDEDGKRHGVKDAWTGTVIANEVVITAAK